ncbi:unnamed protein product [Brassica rapa subsp. trilocularis]|uniref:(rape) hypothetical protein n=1 Tax=Brassica napus TaxID=3708 RepID=A0A816SLD8_BRANA|nr:unnamed protein product [Brassica napus]
MDQMTQNEAKYEKDINDMEVNDTEDSDYVSPLSWKIQLPRFLRQLLDTSLVRMQL